MQNSDTIRTIRAFNRLFMSSMNLLRSHYLGSDYSVAEARIFFEIYENEGCTAAHIAKNLHIDKSYVSRIIKGHEKNNLIRREVSGADGRAFKLYVTEVGKQRIKELVERSEQEIAEVISPLSEEELRTMVGAMKQIMALIDLAEERRG